MGSSSSREVYEFDDFRLDAGHLMLYHKDDELALAPKAVETLVALVQRRGKIASKDELLEAVWPDAVVEESNLFVYLSVLRKTLGTQKDGRPWVETLRRRGYRFSGQVRLVPETNGDAVKLLDPTAQNLATNPHSDNADALRLFLKGQMYARKLTAPEIKLGIKFMREAIDLDPSYAMAYAGIAEAYRSLALAGEVPPDEALPFSQEAAQKAVEVNDRLAEGHSALGFCSYLSDWNWVEAEEHYRRALELDPSSASSHLYYAEFLFRMGRSDEWRSNAMRASELDPHSSFINVFTARAFDSKANPDGALDRVRAVIDSDPSFYFSHLMAGGIYRQKQRYVESLYEYRRAKELSPDQTWSDCGMFETLVNMGKKDEALALLNGLLELSQTRYVPPFHFALIYSQLGDKDRAFKYLDDARSIHDPKLTFLYVEPRLLSLRSDPRYSELLQCVGLPTPQVHS